jgi:putative methyltransferase (TIGR04325 family)
MNVKEIRVHPITFTGVYDTIEGAPHNRQKYGDHRDDGKPCAHTTQKMINVVQSIAKENISVVDFGGGNGKMYSTLKQQTDKSFDYMIVDLPDVNNALGGEVTYYTSLNEIKRPVDIVYTDATVYLTEPSAIENIQNICSLGAEYIVLNRTILFFHEAETLNSDFKKKSFYTWVPFQKNYYNILELSEYEKYFESAGYEITLRTFTQRMDDTPPRQVFSLDGRKIDDPVITYFDHVLRKRS